MADDFVAVAETDNSAEPQVEASTDTPKNTAPVDMSTELAELKAAYNVVEKERNDLKSQTIGRQRAADRDAALHDGINALTRSVHVMMKHMASNDFDTQPLEDAIEAIQENSDKTEANEKWDSLYLNASKLLQEAIIEDGKQILEPNGPELQEARDTWNKATEDGDAQGLLLAANQAMKARLKKERELLSNPEKSDSKPSLEMSVGKTNGSGPRSLDDGEIWKAYGRGDIDFNDDVKKAGKKLGYL